jgi:hypothetical protein
MGSTSLDADSLRSLADTLLAPESSSLVESKENLTGKVTKYDQGSIERQAVEIETGGKDLPLVRHSYSLYEMARENAMVALRYSVSGVIGVIIALLLNSPPIIWIVQQIPEQTQRANGLSSLEPIRWSLFFVMLVFTLISLFILRISWKQMQEAHQLSRDTDETD